MYLIPESFRPVNSDAPYLKTLEGSITDTLPLAHEDYRRIIRDYTDPNNKYSIQHFLIKESIPLGNHFHKRKFEIFKIIEGIGTLFTAKITRKDHNIGLMQKLLLTPGDVVKIPPYFAHTFVLNAGSKMICYSSKPFDQANTDMAPCRLI